MGASVRPESRIERNIAALRSQGATEADVEAYLTQHEGLKPTEQPSLGQRVKEGLGTAASQAYHHPLDALASVVTTPARSLVTALSPGVGEARHSAALSKGGNSSGRPIDTTPYDAILVPAMSRASRGRRKMSQASGGR
jgi:hypothetical protein